MAVFDVNGTQLSAVYDVNGASLNEAYDIDGNVIFNYDVITYETLRDAVSGTTYYVTRVPQTRPNGQKQYPFVYVPFGTNTSNKSTLQMNREQGFRVATNGGRFFTKKVGNNATVSPIGTTIQNGVVIRQGAPETFWQESQIDYQMKVLTIDDEGTLGWAEPLADASTMVANGIVSAVHGFIPLVINGRDAGETIESTYLTNAADAQRQIIGQYPNGDYVFITAEGRGYESSVGWTIPHAIEVCLAMGLEFAFNLDGGGSTETVIGDTQINTIYEGTYGRAVPTFIVFNGTTTF